MLSTSCVPKNPHSICRNCYDDLVKKQCPVCHNIYKIQQTLISAYNRNSQIILTAETQKHNLVDLINRCFGQLPWTFEQTHFLVKGRPYYDLPDNVERAYLVGRSMDIVTNLHFCTTKFVEELLLSHLAKNSRTLPTYITNSFPTYSRSGNFTKAEIYDFVEKNYKSYNPSGVNMNLLQRCLEISIQNLVNRGYLTATNEMLDYHV